MVTQLPSIRNVGWGRSRSRPDIQSSGSEKLLAARMKRYPIPFCIDVHYLLEALGTPLQLAALEAEYLPLRIFHHSSRWHESATLQYSPQHCLMLIQPFCRGREVFLGYFLFFHVSRRRTVHSFHTIRLPTFLASRLVHDYDIMLYARILRHH
jgi:hypothetical protein